MSNPITTKDLIAITDLALVEQWASTKYRHFYNAIEDKDIKKVMKQASLAHGQMRDLLVDFMEKNK